MADTLRIKALNVGEVKRTSQAEVKSMKSFDEYTPTDYRILGVPYGGPIKGRDTDGEAFHEETDIWLKLGDSVPLTYYHGYGPDSPDEWQETPVILGRAKYVGSDERGHWFEPAFDSEQELAQRVMESLPDGVKASSGAVSHLVRMGKAGLIDIWPVGELAVFDTNEWRKPANELAVIEAKDGSTENAAKAKTQPALVVSDKPDKQKKDIAMDKEKRLSLEKMISAIYDGLNKALNFNNTSNKWVDEVFDNYVVIYDEGKYYKYEYSFDGSGVELTGEKVEVERDWKPVSSAKSLYKTTNKENNEMADEQTPQFNMEEVMAKFSQVMDDKLKAWNEPPSTPQPVAVIKAENLGDPDPVKAMKRYMRTGEVTRGLKAAMGETTAGLGGYLVPEDFYGQIIEKRHDLSMARQAGAMVMQTSRDVLNIPTEATSATKFVITAEQASVDENEPTVGSVGVTVYKWTKLVKVSEELLEDDATNLDAFLVNQFAQSLADTENYYTWLGTGSAQPQGITYGGTAGLTFDDSDSIAAAEIPELYYKLKSAYVPNATWTTRQATIGYLRGLASSSVFTFGGHDINEMMIMGKRYFTHDNVAAIAASAKTICFGDWSRYAIVERKGLAIRRLNELYAGNGQVGILATVRWGGAVLQAEAFQYATQHS